MARVAELGMPAVAITDHHNFFGLVKAYKAASELGIKLIVGADLHVIDPVDEERHHELCLLAQNEAGYQNLMWLLSQSYREGQYLGRPRVRLDWIRDHAGGLIALSGGRQGDIGQALAKFTAYLDVELPLDRVLAVPTSVRMQRLILKVQHNLEILLV